MVFRTGCFICLALLAFWIEPGAGAEREASSEGGEELHWAYRPLESISLPVVGSNEFREWESNPVDRFILQGLLERSMTPAGPADRRTLLRRVSFDLTGLPPTLEEMAAFVEDALPDAYERVVERLLASPRYGERWARHWMDLVHFAESHGHDQDRPRENAWPYRDYLIDALNRDKPYALFVEEQLAGDVLFPDDPWAVAATGFLAAGPWDESSLRDIREDSVDRQIGRYLDRDDMVTTTMSTFASTTVHCARCHDHKFDPVSQEDYYNLQAVFAGVDRADREFDRDASVAVRRRELTERLGRLDAQLERLDPALLDPLLQAEIIRWAGEVAGARWHVLSLDGASSANGSTLTLMEDGSVLSGGSRPETDIYTLWGRAGLGKVGAIRLEVLTDDSLPLGGPGRQENGNLHLNEFIVSVASGGSEPKAVRLETVQADFDQAGWTSSMAIDGDAGTAWGIYPQVSRSHQAVFFPVEPLACEPGSVFTVELRQTHGGGHLIGRPRLSVTDSETPLEIDMVPEEVLDLLAVKDRGWSERQRATMAVYFLRRRLEAELGRLPAMSVVYTGNNRFKPDGSFVPAKGPRPVHVLGRGDIHSPGAEARAGALACLPELPASLGLTDTNTEGERRVALARWLTDGRNGLVWRSIVNRVWQHHFGAGLVDTPNDFGQMGSKPTHPQLLDWLALRFLSDGGSLKGLHRLIVTSAAYRQSSNYDSPYQLKDAGNRYLWRMNRRRLDAESLRDAVLMVAGTLDLAMGGGSVKQFNQKPGVHVTPELDYLNFDVDAAANYRRGVYRFVFRTLPDPLMEALDFPDSSMLTPARTESLTPLQALALVNNPFLIRQSEHLAMRLSRSVSDVGGQIRLLYGLTLGREPSGEEVEVVGGYASRHGMANACRYLLNCNEFIFIE